MEYVTLYNGVNMPQLGYGVYQVTQEECERCVLDALDVGYRSLDTAQSYFNEEQVGNAIAKSGVSREEIFLTTKVWIEHYGYEQTTKSVLESMEKLQTSYLDLILLHQPFADYYGAYRALEELYKEGKVRAIGVSNFLTDDLQNILDCCTIKPMVNQMLTHISNTPLELISFCKENDILPEAYSPIAHGEALKNKEIAKMAKKYGVSPAQICIRYVLQLNMVALPKTADPEHMKKNADVEFEISDEDMNLLKSAQKIESYGEYSVFPVFSGK